MNLARSLARGLSRSLSRGLVWGEGGEGDIVTATITGYPYPGETLTSNISGQWYSNGEPIFGETGNTYTIAEGAPVGTVISQNGSSVTVLDPADAMFYPPNDLMFQPSGNLIFA